MAALKEEFEAIVAHARDVHFEREGRAHGRLGDSDVVIALTGDGARRAGKEAALLCDDERPAALVGVGIAGGLAVDLAPLDLLVGVRLRDEAGLAPPPDARLLARAREAGAREATLLTVDRPVVTASGKARLLASVEGGGACAADMESAAWARAAAWRHVPCIVVRAVGDAAGEELPAFLPRCVGRGGSLSRALVVAHAFARPSAVSVLLKMRRRLRDCGERLAGFLEDFLSERAA